MARITRDSFSGTAAKAADVSRRCFFPMPPFKTKTYLATGGKPGGEVLEVLCPAGQQQRAPSRFYGVNNVVGDHLVARGIVDKSSVDILNREPVSSGAIRNSVWRGVTLCSKGVVSVIVRALMLNRTGPHCM